MVPIERLTQDAVYALLATYGSQRDGAIVQAVERLFLAHQNAIRVSWRLKGERESGVERRTARLIPITGPVQLPAGIAREIKRLHGNLSLRFQNAGENGWSANIDAGAGAEDERPMQLTILIEGPLGNDTRERIAAFELYLTGQRAFYWAVHALKSATQAARWQTRLADLVADDRATFHKRLAEAHKLAEDMLSARSTEEADRTVEDAAQWAVQEHLGTGWGVKRLNGTHSAATRRDFCQCLRRYADGALVDSVPTAAREATPSAFQERLACYADILDNIERHALLERLASAAPPEVESQDSLLTGLRLLRDWTRLHEFARQHTPQSEPHDGSWDRLARELLPRLNRYLRTTSHCLSGGVLEHGSNITQLRSWLRLWFCAELLRRWDHLRTQLSPRECWPIRADIAYAIREELRFDCLGDQRTYRFQPAALASALRTLVHLHAHWVVGVASSLDVMAHLHAVGEPRDAHDYHVAMGHLQHVLEVYIAGFFIGNIVLRGVKRFEGWTIAEVLANRGSRPGEQLVREFQCKFAVAALFHDVGVLLGNESRALKDDIYRKNQELTQLFGKSPSQREEAGRSLVERCRDVLGTDYFGADAHAMNGWLARQLDRGIADHGLLGAAYLKRLYKPDPVDAPPEIVRDTCRAILLHGAGACAIEAKSDAAAALLVLCDELFEWGPSTRALPTPNAVSRLPQALAVDVEPHRSRAAKLSFSGLSVDNSGDSLAVTASVLGDYWPRIEMRLCHPEFRDIPAYRTWLSLAQNLGRLIPTRQEGWNPLLVVHSESPEDCSQAFNLLWEVARATTLPLRTGLLAWLRDQEGWDRGEGTASGVEIAYFAGAAKPFDSGPLLGELVGEIEARLDAKDP